MCAILWPPCAPPFFLQAAARHFHVPVTGCCIRRMRRGRRHGPPLGLLFLLLSRALATPQPLDCQALVPDVHDFCPIRSPQAAHTALLPHIAGKTVVELGTRYGDSACCYAQVARATTAVELLPQYCKYLERRASEMRLRNFSVVCRNYREHLPDADVYTWWQQKGDLMNEKVLHHLAALKRAGRIRPAAEAMLFCDNAWPKDVDSLDGLRRRNASGWRWALEVEFDESRLCKRGHRHRRHAVPCGRSKGKFSIASFRF